MTSDATMLELIEAEFHVAVRIPEEPPRLSNRAHAGAALTLRLGAGVVWLTGAGGRVGVPLSSVHWFSAVPAPTVSTGAEPPRATSRARRQPDKAHEHQHDEQTA